MNIYDEPHYCYGCEANVVTGYSLCQDCEDAVADQLIDELWENKFLVITVGAEHAS